MIKVGESTGALADMLNEVADFIDEEVETRVERILALLEPVMLVVMGGIIATLLIAMYLPMFSAWAERCDDGRDLVLAERRDWRGNGARAAASGNASSRRASRRRERRSGWPTALGLEYVDLASSASTPISSAASRSS